MGLNLRLMALWLDAVFLHYLPHTPIQSANKVDLAVGSKTGECCSQR